LFTHDLLGEQAKKLAPSLLRSPSSHAVDSKLNLKSLVHEPSASVEFNEIVRVQVTCRRVLYFDAYDRNRETGAFILIDSLSNATVGAGMIRRALGEQELEEALKEVRAGSGMTPKTEALVSSKKSDGFARHSGHREARRGRREQRTEATGVRKLTLAV
jgi:sulfate adenylyltransferase subunit 1 (EFTu-like GTPase family)